jgi:hypothetical protein
MLRNVSLNLLTSKTIYLVIIPLVLLSGNTCFSTEEFTLKEQEIRQNHLALKEVVEGFYTKIEEKSFFKPPVSRFPKKNQKSFDIKTRINFCSIGVQCIFSSNGKVQATPFQVVKDSQNRRIVASSSSAGQWNISAQEDTEFHLLAWPTDTRKSIFLSFDYLQNEFWGKFLFGLDFKKITTDDSYREVLYEMKSFFSTVMEVIKKIKPDNYASVSALTDNEVGSLEKLNKLFEAGSFPDLRENTSQLKLNEWISFLEDGYLQPEHAQRKIFIDYILSQDNKNKLWSKMIEKYSHFLGVSSEEYRTYDSNPLHGIRFNSENDEHSEPLLSAWIQRNRENLEKKVLFSYLSIDPQLKVLHSIYFLYTHRSTCKNCEEVSHRLISQTPLLISFLAIYEKDDVGKFSVITDLSLNRNDLKRLSEQEKPTDIYNWKNIVRVPVQYNIGE